MVATSLGSKVSVRETRKRVSRPGHQKFGILEKVWGNKAHPANRLPQQIRAKLPIFTQHKSTNG